MFPVLKTFPFSKGGKKLSMFHCTGSIYKTILVLRDGATLQIKVGSGGRVAQSRWWFADLLKNKYPPSSRHREGQRGVHDRNNTLWQKRKILNFGKCKFYSIGGPQKVQKVRVESKA